MDAILQFMIDSLASLRAVALQLAPVALAFLALGLIVKRGQVWTDARRAVAESSLNVQILIFNVVFVLPLIAMAGQAIYAFVHAYGLFLVAPSFWDHVPMPLAIFLGIFIGDFVGYWRHRLEHTPLLWPAHAVHHSDTEMTWLSLERFHPINRVTTFVIDGSALLVLGMPPEAVIANGLVRHYYGFFIHADLPWTFGPLGKVLVSPAMHRWHHAADPAAFDTNYATVFSVFDRAFGTFRVPGPCDVPTGVTDSMGPGLAGQLGYAFTARAYRRLFRKTPRTTPDAAE